MTAKAKKKSSPKAKTKVDNKKDEDQLEQVLKMVDQDGTPVKLSFGEYVVKDLEMMDVIVLAAKFSDLLYLTVQYAGDVEINPTKFLSMLTHVDNVREKLGMLFSMCCGAESDASKFEHIGNEDLQILLPAIATLDWKSIHKNFLQLGVQKYLQPQASTDG